jgi:hypothetical protein
MDNIAEPSYRFALLPPVPLYCFYVITDSKTLADGFQRFRLERNSNNSIVALQTTITQMNLSKEYVPLL